MRFTLLAGIALVGMAPALAVAEPAQDTTTRETVCVSRDTAIRVVSMQGDVRVSTGEGFRPAAPGLALTAGERLVSREGIADLAIGAREVLQVAPHTMVTLVQRDDRTCLREASLDNVGPDYSTLSAGVITAFFVGGLATFALNGDHESAPTHVSP